jgi:hypothetical protein
MGVICHWIYCRLLSKPKTLFRTLVYAAVTVILGIWTVGGPDALANVGLLTVVILKIMMTVSYRFRPVKAQPWSKTQNLQLPLPRPYKQP